MATKEKVVVDYVHSAVASKLQLEDGAAGRAPTGATLHQKTYVTSLHFSRDGERLLSGSYTDGSAHLWDATTHSREQL